MYLDERRKYYPPGGRANNFLRLIFGGEGLFTRVKQRANISSYRFVAVERIEIASSPSKIPSSSVYSRPFSQRHEWGKLEENGGNKELYKCPNYLKDRISKGSWSLEKFEISVLILFVLESRGLLRARTFSLKTYPLLPSFDRDSEYILPIKLCLTKKYSRIKEKDRLIADPLTSF